MSALVASTLVTAERLGVDAFDAKPVELRATARTERNLQQVIRAAYRQVFGNDYIMEAERLKGAESLLRQGSLTVRDFVRALGKSELYKNKFFYPNANQRFVELNFKHFLGRPPYDEREWAYHTCLCEERGFDAEIDSYFESAEYLNRFGNNIVPYYCGFQVEAGSRTANFTRMFQLYRGHATSDRSQAQRHKPRLTWELGKNTTSTIEVPTSPKPRPQRQTPKTAFGGQGNKAARMYRLEVTNLVGAKPQPLQVRRSTQAYLVPYEQLTPRMQQLQRRGGKILSVRPA